MTVERGRKLYADRHTTTKPAADVEVDVEVDNVRPLDLGRARYLARHGNKSARLLVERHDGGDAA